MANNLGGLGLNRAYAKPIGPKRPIGNPAFRLKQQVVPQAEAQPITAAFINASRQTARQQKTAAHLAKAVAKSEASRTFTTGTQAAPKPLSQYEQDHNFVQQYVKVARQDPSWGITIKNSEAKYDRMMKNARRSGRGAVESLAIRRLDDVRKIAGSVVPKEDVAKFHKALAGISGSNRRVG